MDLIVPLNRAETLGEEGNWVGYHITEDVIHHHLEGCWAVREAKEHDLWLKEPLVGMECSLPLVALSDSDIVETPSDIQLSKVLGTSELCD